MTVTSADVNRVVRSLDYLRRSIENQTHAIKAQNEILKHNQATIIHILGGVGAQEGTSSHSGSEASAVPGGGEKAGASGLGEK